MKSKVKCVVIGGSAGSFQIVSQILGGLPKKFKLPVILCLHRLKHVREGFVEALSLKSNIPVVEPDDKEILKNGIAYLAPSNYHMCIELNRSFSLSTEEMVNFSRPSIDITLASAGYVFRDRLVGIILSGANKDGAKGIKAIKDNKGYTIVQNPKSATVTTMPDSAIEITEIDEVLNPEEIVEFLVSLNNSIL